MAGGQEGIVGMGNHSRAGGRVGGRAVGQNVGGPGGRRDTNSSIWLEAHPGPPTSRICGMRSSPLQAILHSQPRTRNRMAALPSPLRAQALLVIIKKVNLALMALFRQTSFHFQWFSFDDKINT